MNLFDMHRRGDRRLTFSENVKATKTRLGTRTYRGFELNKGSTLTITSPLSCHPLREFRRDIGWHAWRLSNDGQLEYRFVEGDRTLTSCSLIDASSGIKSAQSTEIPYPFYQEYDSDRTRLEITCVSGRAFLAVNEANSRDDLIAMCRGRGFEIGPGHQPQIKPSKDTDVGYLEEKSRDEWLATYNESGKISVDDSLWDRYQVGTAAEIPADSGTLDFIFCSHLFEHLANPLGHLEYWSGKLCDGGRVACVIPDIAGSKDYVFKPSSPTEWHAEYALSSMQASRHHFERYARGRGSLNKLEDMISNGYSIHVHFYEPANLAHLLDEAVARGWYRRFGIDHRPNNKDFYFWLIK